MKSPENYSFENAMSSDIENLDWDDELELYTDPTTQLCWLTWLTAMTTPKWVSVKKALPSDLDQVLGFKNFNGVHIFETLFSDEFEDWEITHWMPLPDGPNNKEQNA